MYLKPRLPKSFQSGDGHAINAVLPRGRGIISPCNFCGTRADRSTHAYRVRSKGIAPKLDINIYLYVFGCVYFIIIEIVEIKRGLNTHRSKVSLITYYNDVIISGKYP